MGQTTYHTLLGFCWWDLPAAIILIGVIVFLILRHRKLKRREKELEDAIAEKYSDVESDVEPEA